MTLTERTTPDAALDPGYGALKHHIIDATGLSYYADKDDDLRDRIQRRMTATALHDCAAYLSLLAHPDEGDAELDRLIEELTVGETSFFRHGELFDGLRDTVLPDLLERNRHTRRLRIWSAGCSIGAEAYSLAILLAQDFGERLDGWQVSILGTDINRRFLAQARAGVFHRWDFRGVQRPLIEACFVARTADECVIRPQYRQWVSFQYHNLVRHPFPSLPNNLVAFDLILCRNVLIYFDQPLIRRLVGQFHENLVDGGWLLVGHAEPNVEVFRAFETVNVPGAVLYRKGGTGAPVKPAATVHIAPLPRTITPPPRRAPVVAPPQPARCTTEADRAQLRQLADGGDLDAALRRCVQLIALSPRCASLHFYHAMLAEQLGEHTRAEQSLRRTLYLSPQDALAHYYYGLVQQKRGRPVQALRSFGNTLSLLAGRRDDEPIPEAQSMTVGELRELACMQQDMQREVIEP